MKPWSPKTGKAKLARVLGCLLIALVGAATFPGCLFHLHRNEDLAANVAPGDQPDKILYQKAVGEIDKGRYDVGRLTLQTLINTYPDSEYLAKAKLAVADSYYREGGVSGLTQAEAEYKDFITFFPTAPEAPKAEYRAGMSHYRLMGKADRDLTQARATQAEFQEFLEKYPDNPLMPEVKGRLREVQEVLAEGDFATAALYYRRGANRAAASRFQEIADKYPDFSQADLALWYLGQSLERLKKQDEASVYYARIVAQYPLSPSVRPAKGRLVAMHKPIPKPTRAMLARAEADRAAARHYRRSLLAQLGGVMASSPDVSATRHGPVRIGERPEAGVEEANAQSPSPATASLTAQPLSDSASDAHASGNSAAGDSSGAAETHPAASSADSPTAASPPANSAASGASDTASAPSKTSGQTSKSAGGAQESKDSKNSASDSAHSRQKGKFHFLRKLNPF